MGIYIPNMEIPKSCGKCPFNANSLKCSRTSSEIDRDFEFQARNSDCPLLEVPGPHGRLIDEDSAIKKHENVPIIGEHAKLILNRCETVIEREDE